MNRDYNQVKQWVAYSSFIETLCTLCICIYRNRNSNNPLLVTAIHLFASEHYNIKLIH